MKMTRYIPRITPTQAQRNAWREERRRWQEEHDALVREIVEWLKGQGLWAIAVDRGDTLDIITAIPPTGRLVQFEVKLPPRKNTQTATGGQWSKSQMDLAQKLISIGAAVYEVASLADVQEFVRLLLSGEKAKAQKLGEAA